MRRLLKTVIFLALATLSLLFAMPVSAAEAAGEPCRIYSDGGEYVLVCGDGEMRSDSLTSLFAEVPQGSTVTLDGLSSDGSILISHPSLTLTGSLALTGGATLTLDGGNLTFRAVTLTSEGQAVRIKRGTLTLESGSITARGASVVLDFAASAEYIQTGGAITSTEGVALSVWQGSATVRGGRICSLSDLAVVSSSTLTLVGAPELVGASYDIALSSPATLYEGNAVFRGSARTKLLYGVERGRVKAAFYTESADSLSGISLYSTLGEQLTLRYLEAGEYGCDEGTGAVWLPFFVTFVREGGGETVVECMSSDTVTPPTPPSVSGYAHTGWCYSDGESFDVGASVQGDVTVYATYSLLPPTFRMRGEGFAFDGEERYISISDITHPLLESGYLSFEWYKDGAPLSSYTQTHPIRYASDSGIYEARITFTVGTDTVTVSTPSVDIRITKRVVNIPKIPSKFYTGQHQSPEIAENGIYTAAPVTGREVGIYPVRLTLIDPANNSFFGTLEAHAYSDFEIKRAENSWTESLAISDFYTGGAPIPTARAAFGEVRYLYASAADGLFSSSPPTEAGEYLVRAFVDGTENYTSLESETVAFKVILEVPLAISVKIPPTRESYTAFERIDPEGICVEVVYNSKRCALLYSDSLTFSYQTSGADSLRYGDSGVTVSYMGASVMLPLSVGRAEYDISSVVFSDLTLTFDGEPKTIPQPTGLPVGLDGIPLCATVSGGGTDAADYTVILTFYSESRNYTLPEPISATLTVLPRECEVVWGAREFVYDGGEKLPSAFYTDIYGRRIDLSVEGRHSLAGTYTATVRSENPNYTLKNPTAEYTVLKADYDLSGAVWVGGEFVYNGSSHSVTLTGLPDGVGVIGYLNADATLAGSYVASATLSYDARNYNPPTVPDFAWQVCRAEYPSGGYHFADLAVTYDGGVHYPTLVGEMPCGLDGSVPSYTFSRGVCHVAEGRAAVTVVFSTDSRNYNPPPSLVAFVTVSAMEISVEWGNSEFVYCAAYTVPSAVSEYTSVTVTGGGVDAGDYIARATSDNPDYLVTNCELPFSILRAENAWTAEPSVSDVFYGRLPSPEGACIAGALVPAYYSAASGEPLAEIPRAVGEYILVLSSEGDRNYLPISSEPLRFSVIAVVPVSVSASLTGTPLVAMSSLGEEDITVLLHYNDGTSSPVPHRLAEIQYQSGESLRHSDTELTVSYLGFAVTLPISVGRADYDMSHVRWENTLLVFDGSERVAYLSGLPEGVTVREYISCSATAAGRYPLAATVDYDRENYNPPKIPSGVMIIERCIVPLPIIESVVYDGEWHLPEVPESALYTASFADGVRAAGHYPVRLTLADGANYAFPTGAASASVDFVVARRPITVRVADVRLCLFEEDYVPSFVITEGTLVGSDTLTPTYTERDGRIYARFDSPSYDITVIAGTLEHTRSLSPRALGIIIFSLLLLLLVLLIVYLLLRHRAYAYYSVRSRLFGATAELADPTPPPPPTEEEKKEDTDADAVSEVAAISVEYADGAISDSLAKDLIRRDEVIVTEGRRRGIINVDTLSRAFSAGDRVDVNILKRRSLIPYDTAYIKVLARGIIDKPLEVYANDFSLSAVKMIALSGGKAIRVGTMLAPRTEKNKEKP
ncbi:MAG: uL15 family ribosomal protein [Clostridia bacterium]|nr:uL15 family ribosomal protein [Clostridia bacterium]